MKSIITYILLALISLVIISGEAYAKKVAAFGYFVNESGNESYDYLERILPNSFASTLKNKYRFDVIKPGQLSSIYPDESTGLKRSISEEDLPVITAGISADYFIYGSFKPLENNRLSLTVSIYRIGSASVFRFVEIGYFEAEIFRLVDKIAIQISNIAGDSMLYKTETVAGKSKLAVITNLQGDELNSLYYEMLSGGYRVFPLQGDEIYSQLDDAGMERFYHFSGSNASYHRISSRKEAFLPYGTWSGTDYMNRIKDDKKIYESYIFRYQSLKNETLKKIRGLHSNSADYLLVVGFSSGRGSAWIRCLNLKDNRLIITETEINGSSIDDITKKIITSISTQLADKK